MYILVIGWIYVALMMAVAEAMHSNGTVLGGIITFVLYGLVPVALVVYLMASPARRKARKAREALEAAEARAEHTPDTNPPLDPPSNPPDAGGHAATAAVAPVGKEL